ncbi:MAG TPA: GxxExxY protein [Candidatus Thermoplasmatota archaeon]|nr:GxxExxY protein [Candidatus Thermoplasmatota archaeon]
MTSSDEAAMNHRDVPDKANKAAKAVLDAAFWVHTRTGPGLLERAYRLALVERLRKDGHDVRMEVMMDLSLDDVHVDNAFRVDLVVDGCVIVELKAVQEVLEVHLSQLSTYLRLGGIPVGLLINFNVPRLRKGIYRRVYTGAAGRP